MSETQATPDELESLPQIARAVTTWGDCDVAALVEDGGDVGPVTAGRDVVEINDFDAAPYILVKADER